LKCPQERIYALVGPNGAGKTTAIKILRNILRATSGRAEVLGRDSKRIAGRAFERIGYPLPAFSFGFLEFIWGILPGLVPIAWCVLIARGVQAENLVGDRQFWVTRPYDWYKLLAAKVLFVIVFVNLPLFIVDLILSARGRVPAVVVHRWAAWPASHNDAAGLPADRDQCNGHTKHRAVPTLGTRVGVCMVGSGSLMQEVPNAGMSTGAFPGALIMILIWGACLVVLFWQYARRKTWQCVLRLSAPYWRSS
jgi:energy-coupling factor transporter ATP-binding protein EcfA2